MIPAIVLILLNHCLFSWKPYMGVQAIMCKLKMSSLIFAFISIIHYQLLVHLSTIIIVTVAIAVIITSY